MPKRKTRPRTRPTKKKPVPPPAMPDAEPMNRVVLARQLFWHNVMREILTSLSIISAKGTAPAGAAPATPDRTQARARLSPMISPRVMGEGNEEDGDGLEGEESAVSVPDTDDIFDGRLAIITSLGQRIAIAEVRPVFACGVRTGRDDRWLSSAVECTIFEVRTPSGEVYTLPLHEIHGFHSLTESLMQQIEQASAGQQSEENTEKPFGFAAFTSLARTGGVGAPSEIPYQDLGFQGE